jgi:hypothetical protein
MARKTTPAGLRAFSPTEDHQISLAEAHQLTSTVTVYGKVIKGMTMPPATAGTTHPQGGDGNLQLALVYGVSDGGRCITLATPENVYLPDPDGPADGCSWDPAQFVVWKNLPRDWETLHVQAVKKPLVAALSVRDTALAAFPQVFLSDVLCIDWVGLPATLDNIDDTQTIQTFWEHNHQTSFTFNEQLSLSNVIQQKFGRKFPPQSLVAGTKISDLENWIPATL